MIDTEKTIAAISTPRGRGGIGVVRISGPQAASSALKVFEIEGGGDLLTHRKAHFGRIVDLETGKPVDRGYLVYFRAPHSYTGEETVEISCHSNPVILEKLLTDLTRSGVRLAREGEFTFRAYLNGKIDLIQSEAVKELIESETIEGAMEACSGVEGELSGRLLRIRESLMEIASEMEAMVDFSEEEIDGSRRRCGEGIRCLHREVEGLERSYERGSILKRGLRVAIAGRRNAGKSTLFNLLVGEARAIVTPEPGTTRDTITERYGGSLFPVFLTDTAGFGEHGSRAEEIGMERALGAIEGADLVLYLVDGSTGVDEEDLENLKEIDRRGKERLLVLNKIDLVKKVEKETTFPSGEFRDISCLTGENLDRLKKSLDRWCEEKSAASGDEPFHLVSLRQWSIVRDVRERLEKALAAYEGGLSEEYLLEDIHPCVDRFSELYGYSSREEIYDRIFSRFCIGK